MLSLGYLTKSRIAGSYGQGALACCDSWGRKESDTTEQLNWTELMVILFLIFWGTSMLFSIVAAPFYISIKNPRRFQFLHMLANNCYRLFFSLSLFFFFLNSSHPNRCVVASRYGFHLYLPNDKWYWASVHLLVWSLVYLWKNIKSFFHILNWTIFVVLLLSCRSVLYVLDINPSLSMWFTNIFSYFGCLFTLSIISFDNLKFFT